MSKSADSGEQRLSDQEVLRAVPPTAKAHEFRVGIFVVLGIASFITVLFMMTNPATFRGRYMVATQVEDAGGIRRGDPVQVRGINIGRVHGFELEDEGVLITLEIEGEWQVPEDSRTELSASGVLGGMVVTVIPGASEQFAGPGTVLPGATVGGIFDSAGQLADEATLVLNRIQDFLAESTARDVEVAVASLRDLLANLTDITEGQAEEVRALVASLNRSAQNVEGLTNSPEIQESLEAAEELLATLERTASGTEEAVSTLNTVLARLERGEGTLGQLLTNESLYNSVEETVVSLRELIEDLKENPDRYFKIELF